MAVFDTEMGREGARAAEGMGLGCLVATITGCCCCWEGVVVLLAALGVMVVEGLRVVLLPRDWDGPTLPRFRVSATVEAEGRAGEGLLKAVGRKVEVVAAEEEEELEGGALKGRREARNCCASSCCCCCWATALAAAGLGFFPRAWARLRARALMGALSSHSAARARAVPQAEEMLMPRPLLLPLPPPNPPMVEANGSAAGEEEEGGLREGASARKGSRSSPTAVGEGGKPLSSTPPCPPSV